MKRIAIIWKFGVLILIASVCFSCSPDASQEINQHTLASLGSEFRISYENDAEAYRKRILSDSTDSEALIGLAETQIILHIFGFSPRDETLPEADKAFQRARLIDPSASRVLCLEGKLSLLDWKWKEAERAFHRAIRHDPENLDARHWYSLYLAAMGSMDKALMQSDTILSMDPERNYDIGRGSLLYFARRNMELKDLMMEVVSRDTAVAWGYDWLGMAYIELKEFENSVQTYFRAFELSDGTVEVGGGLGHALGLAGDYRPAKHMADFYAQKAEENYLPPVQRSFIHIGIGEYDEALRLLRQAYHEKSWFLVFMQSEPWYDPLRGDERFESIQSDMKFPG